MSFPAFTPAPLLAATAVAARLRGSRAPRRAPHRGPCTPTSPIAFRRASAPAAGRRGVVTMAAATPTDTKGIMYVKAGPDGKSVGDCPFSLKALLAAALKGVAVDIVPVDLSNKPDTFLALTDAGSTPVFVHGGRTLTDSADIVAYVDTLGDGAAAAGGVSTSEVDVDVIGSKCSVPAQCGMALLCLVGQDTMPAAAELA